MTATTTAPPAPAAAAPNLLLAGLLLAAANFIVVLDTTVANVSVSHIAGSLAVSTNEGTYVITSYAVAEAITVPLTGWLASRFGTVRVFTTCMLLFGLFSGICGIANSLGFLVFGRVMQGLAGGPLMPLSQTLLMRIFPPNKRGTAMALWSMTTLVAPILGPIIGGSICDNWGWPYIFLINIPIAAVCSVAAWRILKPFETETLKVRIDFIGLGLLVLWVAALQIMLDEGKKLDWFSSNEIIILAVTAIIGFAAFMIWEFTERNPIVNMRVFRHRGFSVSVLAISLAFGSFFASVVLTPLWLQGYMGYTSTWSGYTTGAIGVLAVFAAPFAAKLSGRFDPRMLVFFGVCWLGFITYIRAFGTMDMTYSQIALPMLFQGIGMPFFFIPLTTLALSSVDESETASAAGLMSFLRTLSGAFATSIVTTEWENKTNYNHAELAAVITNSDHIPVAMLDHMVQAQSVMIATNQIFMTLSVVFVFAACVIWLAPRPQRSADLSAAH